MEEKVVFEGSENDRKKKTGKTAHNRKGMIGVLKSKIFIAACVVVSIILVCLLVFPIYRIEDSSMSPTLREGDIVLALPVKAVQGDIAAVRYNRMILVRRIISEGGETIDIDSLGGIYINSEKLDEPYIVQNSRGYCDISLPYKVPEGRLFIVGDNRESSIDSRNSVLGSVNYEAVEGVLFLRIWPISGLGLL